MDMIGVQRPRGRDLATGIVRGAGLGLARAVPVLGHHAHQHHRGDDHHPVRLAVHHLQLAHPGDRGVQRCSHWASCWCCTGRCCSARPPPTWPRRAASASALVGAAVPGRDRAHGLAVGHDHRRDPEHRAARRARRDRAAADQPARAGHGLGRADRPGRHLARRAAGLRQLLLAAGPARLAGQLLRGHAGPGLLPAPRPRPVEAGGGADVLRVHDQHLGSGQHRRRGGRRGRLLRRAARRGVRR